MEQTSHEFAAPSRHDVVRVRTVGFVGTGFIAEAMVDAFVGTGGPAVVVSPRGEAIAARLAARYPNSVRVATSNQAVVDASDVVVLAVRPQGAGDVLASLRFREGQRLVNVVAGLSLDELQQRVGRGVGVVTAIPLPAMRSGHGATVMMPPDPVLSELFARGGTVVETEDARAYAALGTATAIMASYFAVADAVSGWLGEHGLPADRARAYVAGLLRGLGATTEADPMCDFAKLADAHATPGSFNEHLRERLRDTGTFSMLRTALDELLPRMSGPPD